jgi:hypothetical protein
MKMVALIIATGIFTQAKERPPQGTGVDVGMDAPAWKLKIQDGKSEVELAEFKGKPVFLVFGSYT